MIGIYKITSPTGRVYIGQSVNIERRFSQYRRIDKSVKVSVKLYRSLLKHGVSSHTFEVIEECSMCELNTKERFYQDKYNANSEDNLNCMLTSTSEKKGVRRKISEEQKKQISLVHKGKKYSEDTKRKIREARAKQVITKEHREAISKNNAGSRLVLNVENGIFYSSAREASDIYGIKHNSLICRLIGKVRNKSNLIYA